MIPNSLEASITIDRKAGAVSSAMLDTFLADFSIQLEPFTIEQVRLARQAFQRFGKTRHPAV